jgi:hypothetical protein
MSAAVQKPNCRRLPQLPHLRQCASCASPFIGLANWRNRRSPAKREGDRGFGIGSAGGGDHAGSLRATTEKLGFSTMTEGTDRLPAHLEVGYG